MSWQVVAELLFLNLVKGACFLLFACSYSVFIYFHTDLFFFFGKTEIQTHIIIETGAIVVVISPTEIIRNIFMSIFLFCIFWM
jgi:hypothetical protein